MSSPIKFTRPIYQVRLLCVHALILSVLLMFSPLSSAQSINDPIATVSSSNILKTEDGSLLVLYGIESPLLGTHAADEARDFTSEHTIGKEIAIEKYEEKYGLTYVKVILPDGNDLSELLLHNGLATWDKATWPELAKLGELEEQGKQAAAQRREEAKIQREAEMAAREVQYREEAKAREVERQARDWERQVKQWGDMTPSQRQAVHASLEARRAALEPKMERARKLYNFIMSLDETLSYMADLKAQADKAYSGYKNYFGPSLSIEFRMRELDDSQAESEERFRGLVTELNRLSAEINAEYPAYEQERQRVAALEATLPEEERVAVTTSRRTIVARAAEEAADSSGTGFVIARDHLMTCAHVVRHARTIRVITRDGNMYPATVVAEDSDSDWSLLRVSGITATPIPISKEVPEVGSTVFNLGYPLGSLMESVDPIVGSGNIAALQGLRGDSRHIQVTVPLNKGASGSPIINTNGEWVGLASHKLSDLVALNAIGSVPQGLNFAVKADFIESSASLKLDLDFAQGGSEIPMTLQDVAKQYSEAVVMVLVERR